MSSTVGTALWRLDELIAELELPKVTIYQDVEAKRLAVTVQEGVAFVELDEFVFYFAMRVPNLEKTEQLRFWRALKKFVTHPKQTGLYSVDDITQLLMAIEAQIQAINPGN